MTATIHRVVFFNEETGYAILKATLPDNPEPVTIVGNAPTVTAGETVEATGTWTNNPNYGRQFKAESIKTTAPDTADAITRYLGSGLVEGIGPVYAQKIVAKFGTGTLDVIDTASKRLEEIDGIGSKRRKEIKTSWEQQKSIRKIMLFLHHNKVPATRAVRIYKHYGAGAIDVLNNNPYQLAEDIYGIGFKTADQIAANLGITGNDPRRLGAAVLHTLESAAANNGHTALSTADLEHTTAALVSAPDTGIHTAIAGLVRQQKLAPVTIGGQPHLALPRLLHAENGIAHHLQRLLAKPPSYPPIDIPAALAWAQEKTGITLAESQSAAVTAALNSRALVLTGGPGTGKTTIVNTILTILQQKGSKPALTAPTGRAAKRMTETTGLEALTLHRLLEFQPGKGFARNAGHQLSGHDLYVLDEASMVDAPLMNAFLQALPDDAHLLVVGDVDQLPSVGPGNVLRDIIDSKTIPVARLTEIFRQAATSQIIQAAHAINHGQLPGFPTKDQGRNTTDKIEDFFFIERPTPESIAKTLPHLVRDRIPGKFKLDPLHDNQVLTPMNRGPAGVANLNHVLQQTLNPPNEFKPEIERYDTNFRVGDKVIQTRNNYDLDVYNGDIGHVAEITTDPVLLRVRYAGRQDLTTYATTELDEIQHAYAITVHKSQGSEFPCVVIPVTSAHHIMLQRNLIYTAVTRGKSLVILLGQIAALTKATNTTTSQNRTTTLPEHGRPDTGL
ncbi:MAG: ATP-dependent RecD-like DNA helicase [Verrucomicrobiales bacterium]|nr:ATP-dependent RecD-like DNA helicase [Verrucomicrobiales bacterium]